MQDGDDLRSYSSRLKNKRVCLSPPLSPSLSLSLSSSVFLTKHSHKFLPYLSLTLPPSPSSHPVTDQTKRETTPHLSPPVVVSPTALRRSSYGRRGFTTWSPATKTQWWPMLSSTTRRQRSSSKSRCSKIGEQLSLYSCYLEDVCFTLVILRMCVLPFLVIFCLCLASFQVRGQRPGHCGPQS